jgi:hypothetical protein
MDVTKRKAIVRKRSQFVQSQSSKNRSLVNQCSLVADPIKFGYAIISLLHSGSPFRMGKASFKGRRRATRSLVSSASVRANIEFNLRRQFKTFRSVTMIIVAQ